MIKSLKLDPKSGQVMVMYLDLQQKIFWYLEEQKVIGVLCHMHLQTHIYVDLVMQVQTNMEKSLKDIIG